jgi:hypothetical protein
MIKDAMLQDLHFFTEIQVGTLPRKDKSFYFLKSTIHSSDNLLLRQQRLQQLLKCRFDWSKMSRTQASLFGEGQDGVCRIRIHGARGLAMGV